MTINLVCLVGNIANDPEFRTTTNGNAVCSFRIACQRRFKNDQGVYEADFISCVAWRQAAEFIHKYFIKGNKIGLTGSIQTRSYQAQDGSKRYVTEVVVDNAEFVSAKGDAQNRAPTPQPKQAYAEQMNMGQADDDDDDGLPFE